MVEHVKDKSVFTSKVSVHVDDIGEQRHGQGEVGVGVHWEEEVGGDIGGVMFLQPEVSGAVVRARGSE